MTQYARLALIWSLYGCGDLWCRMAVNRGLGWYFEWPYRFYSFLMVSAYELQGDDPRGPWQKAHPATPAEQDKSQ